MLKPLILATLLLPAMAFAQPAILTLEDPAGDDHGDGTLVYPRRNDLGAGDLDLRALRVFRDSGGFRFEATFQNTIKDPAKVSNDVGSNEPLSLFARRGFYAFNLDIYIDIDRIPGSGNVATLPGRRARVDAAHAWDKAIVLTPRPEVMRRQFQDALTEAAGKDAGDLGATVDRSVFFPTEVRVRGKSISFFVPDSFLGSTAAADWSLVAFVTGAKVNIESDLRLFGANTAPALQRLALGALQPAGGRPNDTFGYSGDAAPATPIVDLLGPAGTQPRQLASGAVLVGVDRHTRAASVSAAPPPTAPAAAPPAAGGGSLFSRMLDAVNRMFGLGSTPAPVAPAAGAATTPTLQSLLQPGAAAAPVAPTAPVPPAAAAAPTAPVVAPVVTPSPAPAPAPATSVPAPARPAPAATPAEGGKPRDAAFFEEQELRLRALKRLRDANLISEQEYQQKRKEVIDRL